MRDQSATSSRRRARCPRLTWRHGAAQIAQRQIGPLRQEKRRRALRPAHVTLRVGPQPGQGAQQRRLAAARGAFDQQALPRAHLQVQFVQQRAAIRPRHRDAVDLHRVGQRLGLHGRQGARGFVGIQESVQPVQRGTVLRKGIVGRTKE
ncbi:hypothetical protein G6F65_019292 [Rhizopus arrhizus]|nr:hypothetical protein G6F65_019292 [Rhizopus arrhizus]